MIEVGYCLTCDEEIEVEMCCSGLECGCMGRPIDPPFCSVKCYEEYIKNKISRELLGG